MTKSHPNAFKPAAPSGSFPWDSAYAPVPGGGAISPVPDDIASGDDVLAAQPAVIVVSAGVTSTNLVTSGNTHLVVVYGTIVDAQLLKGASLTVHKGGVAIDTTVISQNFQDTDVYVNGVMDNAVLSRSVDGSIAGQGAAGNNISVTSGAALEVYDSGTATSTFVYSGATQSVGLGGVVSSSVVASGGQNYVFSGGVSSNTQISAGGYEFVSANGFSVSANIAGFQILSSGGVSDGATVQAGGNITVLNDGFNEFATIGGTVTVSGGGETYGDQIDAGGVVSVLAGGFQVFDTVNVGGNAVVDGGNEYSLTVEAGGTLTYSGGFLNSTTLQTGVQSGATVSAIGGMLSGLNVHRGVMLNVGQGVETMFTVVSAGGIETLNGGTELSGDILAGGTLTGFGTVTSLTDQGTLVASGGTLTVTNAITGSGTLAVDAGADLRLLGGGSLTTTSIIGAGTLEFGGSTAFTLVATLAAPPHIIIDAGATLDERGSITGAILDNGTLDIPALNAPGGTTVLKGAVTGSGTLSADSHELLALNGGATFSGALSGAGTIQFNSNVALDTGASLQVGELLTNHNLTLGAGTTLTNLAGHSLVLDETVATGTVSVTGPTATTGLINDGAFLAEGVGSDRVTTAFTNLGTVTLNGKALSFNGPLSNNGTIDAASGSLYIASAITGTGKLEIGATGTLTLNGAAQATQATDFLAATGDLSLTNPLNFHGIVGGFTQGDLIDLLGTTVTSLSYANNVLTVKDGTATVASLHFTGLSSSASFTMSTDSAGGTFIKLH